MLTRATTLATSTLLCASRRSAFTGARCFSTQAMHTNAGSSVSSTSSVPFSITANGSASFSSSSGKRKILCVLYPGGEAGARNPKLLGCVEQGLGLRDWIKRVGPLGEQVELIVTADHTLPNSVFEQHLPDAEVVISQPFYPAYMTAQRLDKAKKLKMVITAGVGSDHVDLQAAQRRGVTVAEVTGSNVTSVAEQVILSMLSLVRNFIPGHKQVLEGKWDIAAVASRAYDLQGKSIGTIGAGRIGVRVLERLQHFDAKLHYYDKFRHPAAVEEQLNATYHSTVESLLAACDVVTINCPLHPETEGMINAKMISKMKKGSYLVNTARAKIVDRDAVVAALKSGHLAGYAGDVWFPQPAPPDHPWRHMPNHAMTVHYSGTTLDAQARYAAGTQEILERYLKDQPIAEPYLIVDKGVLVSPAYTEGDATAGALPPMA